MAVVAALLVTAGFAALFTVAPTLNLKLSHGAASAEEDLFLNAPAPPPRRLSPRARPRAPAAREPTVRSDWPPVPPPITAALPAPGVYSQQDYLDERAQRNAAALKGQVTGSELKRDLGKETERPALFDNQSYRTVDGQRVERGGGGCTESQTQQGSSSPTNHFDVARPISCPGDAPDESQQMRKALDDWAKQAHQVQSPPP